MRQCASYQLTSFMSCFLVGGSLPLREEVLNPSVIDFRNISEEIQTDVLNDKEAAQLSESAVINTL